MAATRKVPPAGAWKALAEQVAGFPVSGIAMVAVLDSPEVDEFGIRWIEWTYEGEVRGASQFRRRRKGFADVVRRVVVKGAR